MSILHKIALFTLVSCFTITVANKYRGICNCSGLPMDCEIALFSKYSNFSISGVKTYIPDDKFCDIDVKQRSSGDRIAIIHRGDCSFETKAVSAASRGYKALFIINVDDTLFPVGAQNEDYKSTIPVFLIPNSTLPRLLQNPQCAMTGDNPASECSCQYDQAEPSAVELAPSAGAVCLWILSCLPAAVTALALCPLAAKGRTLPLAAYGCFLIVFVCLRLATLRPLSLSPLMYNHNETDERIFETLVENVSRDWTDYRLSRDVISRFRLAPENYDHELFLHPPLFVASAAALHKYVGVPLPVVPVLMQTMTMAMLPSLVAAAFPASRWRDGLWSMVIFASCPIAMFVSQKFWIDNCSMFTVTLTSLVHLKMCSRNSNGALFLSGLVFGLFALQTKITSLASLPFLFLAIAKHQATRLHGLSAIAVSCIYFSIGALLAFGPWIAIYKVRTGMWLPSAWPSAVMVARSSYLQSVIAKPWHAYIVALSQLSPIHITGLAFIFVVILHALKSIRSNKVSTELTFCMQYLLMASLPICYLIGLTAVGVLGGGFQLRFLSPILPTTSVLAAVTLHHCNEWSDGAMSPIFTCLVSYGSVLCLFCGIMFTPMFADVDTSLPNLIDGILNSPYYSPSTKEEMISIFQFLAHFGLQRRIE